MSATPFRISVVAFSLALAAGAAHARTLRSQVAASPHGQVDIRNVAGNIQIRGWDKPAVSVTADLASGQQLVVAKSGNGRTKVCVTNGAAGCNGWGWSGRAEKARLEVRVPRGSEVDASGVSAGIDSRGVAGVQNLHTVSGNIDAQLGSGHDDVQSVSGSIHLLGSGQDGTLRIANVSGDLSATNVAGELDARTVNGSLSAQLSAARAVRLHTTSGSIRLDARLARGGTVQTDTVSGYQSIKVESAAGYSYEAKTFSGDIENCFGQQEQHNQYGPGSRLEGRQGAGGGHVRIRSLSGGITLCDH